MNNDRRVVITGLGVVTPVGNKIETFWSNLKNGVRGIRAIDAFDTAGYDDKIDEKVRDADLFLAGGSEASIVEIGLAGFSAMKALSTRNDEPERASRPFDRDRDGFVMSEGAGVVVVEELEHAKARGAKIYCEITGYGLSADPS